MKILARRFQRVEERLIVWKGSDRVEVSRGDGKLKMTFPMGCVGEAGGEVFGFQFWEVFEDLFLGHSSGKIFEYVFHRDAHSPDAGLAAAHVGSNSD